MTTGDPGAALLAAAGRLARQLAEPPETEGWRRQSLSKGAAGVAILHGARAQSGHGSPDLAHAWLGSAAGAGVAGDPGTGLWFGAAAVAFAMAAAAPGHYPAASRALQDAIGDTTRARLAAARRRIESGARPPIAEYDLVRGLTGLGAYLLCRRSRNSALPRIWWSLTAGDAGPVFAGVTGRDRRCRHDLGCAGVSA